MRTLCLFTLLFPAALPAAAVEVFSSGTLPDLTDATNFVVSNDSVAEGVFINHFLPLDAPTPPVTVRSIEFYGYSLYLPFAGADGVQDFELIAGPDPINVLAIERLDVGPAVASVLPGIASTPVQRIRIDFDPITVNAGDQVLIRGVTEEPEEFYAAKSDPALAGITYTLFSDSNLTVTVSTTLGEALYFSFNDSFEVLAPTTPGDFTGDGAVDNDDLNLLLANWGKTSVPPAWVNGFEPPVDNDELNALLANWGAGVAAIPEPGAVILCCVGLAVVWRRR